MADEDDLVDYEEDEAQPQEEGKGEQKEVKK